MGFNKGEWSELYAFLYLLKNNDLVIVDENLVPIHDDIFKILEIILNDKKFKIEEDYIYKFYNKTKEISEYQQKPISESLEVLLKKIQAQKSSKGSFDIPEIKSFINEFFDGQKVKGKSKTKADLEANTLDRRQNRKVNLTYNIKSELGAKATLLNASNHTNFLYEIENIDDDILSNVNSIKTRTKLLDRCKLLTSKGAKFKFIETTSKVFSENLRLVDTKLDEILANMLILSYIQNEKDIKKLIDLSTNNESDKIYFNKKLCDFASAVTFGMRAGEVWNGKNEINGGILLVEKSGDVFLLDLIYFKDLVDKYLIKSIKLDSPSSSRYKMCEVFKRGEKFYFTLNLQIRFK
jgi:hypothetical protein